jgi:hypothetical protein
VASDCKRWLGEVDQRLEQEKAAQAAAAASVEKTPSPANAEAPSPVAAPEPPSADQDALPTDDPRHVPTSFWAVSTVAATAIGSFAYFGLTGRTKEDELVGSCAPHCASSQANDVRTRYTIADVSAVVGVAAIGVATWILLSRAPANDKTAAASRVDFGGLHF